MHWKSFKRFPLVRLLLAFAIGALWLRSRGTSDVLALYAHHATLQMLASDRGSAIVAFSNIQFGPQRSYTFKHFSMPDTGFDDVRNLLYSNPPLPKKLAGIYLGGSPDDPFGITGARYQYFILPFPYLLGLSIIALIIGLRTFWLRRRWGLPGMCRNCGYDLRASADRCPECGTAINLPE